MPNCSLSRVLQYASKHCGWSVERMWAFEQDDGYGLFQGRHVQSLDLGDIEGHQHHVYMRATVKAEMSHSTKYATWILLCTDGEMVSAGCGCVAA